MTQQSWNEITDRAAEFASKWDGETYEKGESQSFWSDFLAVFGIDRRRHGAFFEYAIKKGSGSQGFIDMFWPGKFLAEQKSGGRDLHKAGVQAYEYLETMPDHDLPEAIAVSDFATFELIHLETREKLEFKLEDLPKHVKSFAFLIGQKSQYLAEQHPVNRQAAEAMASLHNQLRDDNYDGHDLEVLLVRLVFCMFADDSGIFDQAALHTYLNTRTSDDGSDLGPRLMQVFQALNTPIDQRQNSLDESIASLPYVNGGLFADSIDSPNFSAAMRRELLKAMQLDWSKVSPAIFGSMFQGVMDEKQRRNLGAHYTSEKNILRVIKPLFLDDLYAEFASARSAGVRKKFDELRKLQDKIASLKFLDPACGCGNFLVITYRELRLLEHKILKILSKGNDTVDMFASAGEGISTIKIDVDQMYGIEIEEFPALIAQTALWLTDHQMNIEYSKESGRTFKRLPLKKSATIVHDNALTKDWTEIIVPKDLDYILGNPPFVGSKMMNETMRHELQAQFGNYKGAGVLDFVSAWYAKATSVMRQNPRIQTALVSTNSITQGEQVPILWQYLIEQGVVINFAHRTFRWSNDAKGNAAVYCVVIGFGVTASNHKQIFDYPDIKAEPIEQSVKNINPYLIDAPNIFIDRRGKPICDVPRMSFGNMPLDGGNLILSDSEKSDLILSEPNSAKYIKQLIGAKEFIQNSTRWCLWLVGVSPNEIQSMPKVMARIAKVRDFRLASKAPSTNEQAIRSNEFRDTQNPSNYILVPRVSSEKRLYVPMGFFGKDEIAGDSCQIIPNAGLYHFGILNSQMHMAWMRAVAGRLKSDYRYSKDIVYNNFIWPDTNQLQQAEIERLTRVILDARTQYPDASLADLYDPLTMPAVLAKAHHALDRAVDKLYSSEPLATDAERVALLFRAYQDKSS